MWRNTKKIRRHFKLSEMEFMWMKQGFLIIYMKKTYLKCTDNRLL